ncbi:MAG: PAS domain S-box protein [Melioribacteraceae bacterium]|nr:PAS domain S-box protein [Melioribacteraceae bacterium]
MNSLENLVQFNKHVIENADKGIIYLDVSDNILFANKYIYNLFEAEEGSLERESINIIFQNLKVSSISPPDFKSKSSFNFEIKTRSGSKKSIKIESEYIKDGDNKDIGSYVFIWDITDFISVSSEIKENEQLYNLVYESANDGICIIDQDKDCLIDCNKKTAELFGTDREQLLSKKISTLTPKEYYNDSKNQDRLKTALANLEEGSKTVLLEWVHERFDGTQFFSEISISKFRSKNRKLLIGIMRDVSERKLNEEEINHRINVERMISSISSRFINLRTDKLEMEFHWALKEIGRFYQLDKSSLYLYSDNYKKINCFAEWRKDNIEAASKLQNLNVGEFNWWTDQLLNNQIIRISNKSDFPNRDKLSELINGNCEYSSIMISPIKDGYKLIGFWSLVSFEKEVKWNEYNDTLMSIIGEIFSNALIKRKQENVIIESEKRFRTLVDTTSSLIFILQNEKIVFANEAAKKSVSYGSSIIDFPLIDIIHKDYKSFVENSITKILLGKEKTIFGDIKTITLQGSFKWFDFNAAKINYIGKEAVIITANDITAIKEVEEKLINYNEKLEKAINDKTEELKGVNQNLIDNNRELSIAKENLNNQLKLLEILIDNIPIPLIIFGADKKILRCNKSFEVFTGDKNDAIIGMDFELAYINEFADQYIGFINELYKNGGTRTTELSAINHHGEYRTVLAFGSSFENRDGKNEGVILTYLDITEQKKAEYEVLKSLGKQKELNSLKTQFISTASHELRTPLTTILSSADYLEILGDKIIKTSNDKYFEHILRIQQTVKHLTEMMDDLLTLNRTEIGKIEFNPASVNISLICDKILFDLEAYKKVNQHINFSINANHTNYYADKTLIRLIISNLLSNAIKYSCNECEIKFSVSEKGNELEICISDNGMGIAEHDQKKLFEPFFRSESVREIAGSGLGLSIVKKAVDLHGGKIVFKSEYKKGTEFKVYIPIRKGEF